MPLISDTSQTKKLKKYNINIMALKKDGKLDMNISSDTCLNEMHTMLVLGDMKSIHKCFHI